MDGYPPPISARPTLRSGGTGVIPNNTLTGPPCDRDQDDEGPPQTQQRAQTARGQEGSGDGLRMPMAHGPSPEEGGEPPERQRALPAHGMPEQEEGNPLSQEEE